MNPVRTLSRAARVFRINNGSYKRVTTASAHFHLCAAANSGTGSALTQQKQQHGICSRLYSNQTETDSCLDSVTYDRVCSETLDGLSDYFDELVENATELTGTDVAYGVRTRNPRKPAISIDCYIM